MSVGFILLSILAGVFLGALLMFLRLNERWTQKKLAWLETNTSLKINNEQLEKELKNYKEKEHDKEELFKQLEEKSKMVFENIANKIFQSKTESYQKESEKSLNALLNPLKDKITNFEEKVQNCYEKEAKERFSLKEEIKKITKTNQDLTQALKGDIKTQGDWGEVVLTRILENSGLQEGKEFTVQGKGLNLKNEEGKLLKPDVIVHLPDKRHIIIDSKVSLTHYYKYTSSESKEERKQYEKQIVSSLSQHIDNLAKKSYNMAKEINTPDFVLMFIPLEGALSLALQTERKLFEQAWRQSIAIVSPITLFATLKTISTLWKIDDQNKNAQEIAIESGRLYDKFIGFLKNMKDLGKGLESAQTHYDEARKKLQEGRGNLISKAEKIKKLGANTTKNLAQDFINEENLSKSSLSKH